MTFDHQFPKEGIFSLGQGIGTAEGPVDLTHDVPESPVHYFVVDEQ